MPALSSPSALLAVSYLPPEVLFSIFGHLDDPRHLYHASLTCRAWRVAALDARLWEDFYWRYYRGGQGRKEDQSLASRATQRRYAAMRQWFRQTASSSSPLPPFLDGSIVRTSALPDFTALFARRMAKDDRLLQQLRKHIALSARTLDSMLQIVRLYGDASRELLAALVADQQLSKGTVAAVVFHDSKDKPALRALDVHSRAAAGQSLPQHQDCLALRHAAQTILSHLQRREAIRSLATLRSRWEAKGKEAKTLRQRALTMSSGVEEAFSDLALFRSGERTEVAAYLDLLALYVWAWLAAKQNKGHAGPQAAVFDSTRALMTSINLALYGLKFGVAVGPNESDCNNSFLNVVLCCPSQRASVAPTLMTITCAVARRLGVAASPINTPHVAMAVVYEDSPAPAKSMGDHEERDWKRFFLVPCTDGPTAITEIGHLKLMVAALDEEDGQASDLGKILEPASPDVIMYHALLHMAQILQHTPHMVQGDLVGGPSVPAHGGGTRKKPPKTPRDALGQLSSYLAGHASSPPWPLAPPLLASTLAFLPSTLAGAPRFDPFASRDDVGCTVAWVNRLTAAATSNASQDWDKQIMANCVGELTEYGPYRADIAILLELGGGDIKWLLSTAGQRGTEDESEEGEHQSTQAQQRDPPQELVNRASLVLEADKLPCYGIGGSGGPRQAQRDPSVVRVLDESFPANVRARYHIGTVFKHRVHGYYGVVVGRESHCQAPESWIVAQRVDELPGGGRHQPFYRVIVAHDEYPRSIAQCNIVPVSLSSSKGAAILQELVPLFNMRAVGKLFRTVQVVKSGVAGAEGNEKGKGGGKKKLKAASEGKEGAGEVRLVMNEWFRTAWPHD